MNLGDMLGPYEILASLGAGGMGEVYKARDTRLDRTVAIKVLPAELSGDPDRRVRFEREARAVAALSHPHICTLYDIGSHDGTTYLVMEHLAGESLADRLSRGPLPVAQALDLGAQIAEALDAAHKHGIIHRDLKPGNVMLTGGGLGRPGVTSAKLLDFGLAKLVAHGERPALATDASASTQTVPMTARGAIVGTLQYMAPEQLEGREADARTDLWGLGAILYEMLAGRRAFAGDTEVSLIGNIMNAEPAALASRQPLTPPALDRVVRKCLAKHPDGRWDSARDVADELRWIAQTAATGADRPWRPGPRQLTGAIAGALLIFAAGAGLMWVLRPADPVVLSRPSLDVRPAEEVDATGLAPAYVDTPGGSRTALVWTPDGQALVFVGRRNGVQHLYVRGLGNEEARPLAGTEGAQVPAVSHDGRWVAFWSAGAIRMLPVGGGPVTELAPGVRTPPWGMAWDESGRLLFGHDLGIWQVPPGAAPAAVTTVGEREMRHVLPCPLPGSRVFVYTVRKRERSWGDEQIVAHTLATGERKVLLQDAADARYVPSGHLVFLRRGTLFAVPFDAGRLEVQGAPVAVLETVVQALTSQHSGDVTGAGQFGVAPTGALAWVRGPVIPHREADLVAVDRHGQITALPIDPHAYWAGVSLSPDGRRLAVVVQDLTEAGLWLFDLDRETLTPLARGGDARWPVWSPDGTRVAFGWRKDGMGSMGIQSADGTSAPQFLSVGALTPSSWPSDGRHLVGVRGGDVVVATPDGEKPDVRPLFETPDIEESPAVSPDGRWLAYASNRSGRFEVYVRPFPGPGVAQPVSRDGGRSPAWSPRGNELFFVTPRDASNKECMLVAELSAGPPSPAGSDHVGPRAVEGPRIGRPQKMFEAAPDLVLGCTPVRCYDVSADGQRFYAWRLRPAPPRPPVTHINLILNWFEELKAKVPTTR